MKLVVGLGNPGEKYARTRHNVGFWVIDEIARMLDIPCNRTKWQAEYGEARIGNEKVVLLKPQTYMNLSGESIAQVLAYYRDIQPDKDLILIYDDMDFPPGQVRLREQGSAGGHNGVKSVISVLGSSVFPRIRVGVGRPRPGVEVITHVLTPFSKDDDALVQPAVRHAAEAAQFAVEHSFQLAMNRYNTSGM